MQRVFGVFIVCLLLQSCNSNKKNVGVDSNALIMYEPSEMTILMRRIYEFNKVVKTQIISKDSLSAIPDEFANIHTANLTDPSERDDEFKSLAKSFIGFQKTAFSSNSDSTVYQFNESINACIECHKTRCTGPLPKIRKLLIN